MSRFSEPITVWRNRIGTAYAARKPAARAAGLNLGHRVSSSARSALDSGRPPRWLPAIPRYLILALFFSGGTWFTWTFQRQRGGHPVAGPPAIQPH